MLLLDQIQLIFTSKFDVYTVKFQLLFMVYFNHVVKFEDPPDQKMKNVSELLFYNLVYRPSQYFFSHVRTEPSLLGYGSVLWRVNVPSQGYNTVPPMGI